MTARGRGIGRRALALAGGLALAAGLAGGGAASADSVPGKGAPPRLYSAAQAAEGAALYGERCAMCHGRNLEGTFEVPALTGKFVANWGGRPLGELSAYLGRAMPQFAPGSLAPEDSARLVAYLLQANGYPAGAEPLPAEGARQLTVLPAPPHPG